MLAIYTGTSVNALTPNAAKVVFTPIPGATYYIAVDGYDDGTGAADGTINLSWHVTRSTKATDFDGDNRSDFAAYYPSNGTWYISLATGEFRAVPFGASGDTPATADNLIQ